MKDLVSEVGSRFGFAVDSYERLERDDGDKTLVLKIADSSGREFFLKQVSERALDAGIETVYRDLSFVKPRGFDLVVPIKAPDGGFLFRRGDASWLLYPWIDMEYFASHRAPHLETLGRVSELHRLARGFSWPARPNRRLREWTERGLVDLEARFGRETPIFAHLRELVAERLPRLSFALGNIHGDIHEHNLAIGSDGRWKLLDFDEAHGGELFLDYARATAMYVESPFNGSERVRVAPAMIDELLAVTGAIATGLTARDAKLILARVLLGPLRDPAYPHPETVPSFLRNLQEMVAR